MPSPVVLFVFCSRHLGSNPASFGSSTCFEQALLATIRHSTLNYVTKCTNFSARVRILRNCVRFRLVHDNASMRSWQSWITCMLRAVHSSDACNTLHRLLRGFLKRPGSISCLCLSNMSESGYLNCVDDEPLMANISLGVLASVAIAFFVMRKMSKQKTCVNRDRKNIVVVVKVVGGRLNEFLDICCAFT